MLHRHPKMTWVRTVALTWLTAWMLVVPLVHVHPEADHRHDAPGHIHHGIVHTVFSSDLSCEYVALYDVDSPGNASTSIDLIGPSAHALNHPEFGFSLALSEDYPFGKPAPIDTVSSTWQTEPEALTSSSVPILPLASPPCLFLSTSLSSRAPPFSSI